MPAPRLLAALIFAMPVAAAAQIDGIPPARYPSLPAQAANAAGFVPQGWVLEASAVGDLNGDGRKDFALVLRQQDRANLLAHDGFCENPLDTNPRILAVAFAEAAGGYRLALQNRDFIPRRDNPCALDAFSAEGGIEISRGSLRLFFEHMMSVGGWGAGTTSYAFRWRQGAMRLIGFDHSNVQRNTGCLNTISINYLTRRTRATRAWMSSEGEEVRWRRLPAQPLPTLAAIGDGMTFDPGRLIENMPSCDGLAGGPG
jgi:hypothetical protein